MKLQVEVKPVDAPMCGASNDKCQRMGGKCEMVGFYPGSCSWTGEGIIKGDDLCEENLPPGYAGGGCHCVSDPKCLGSDPEEPVGPSTKKTTEEPMCTTNDKCTQLGGRCGLFQVYPGSCFMNNATIKGEGLCGRGGGKGVGCACADLNSDCFESEPVGPSTEKTTEEPKCATNDKCKELGGWCGWFPAVPGSCYMNNATIKGEGLCGGPRGVGAGCACADLNSDCFNGQ